MAAVSDEELLEFFEARGVNITINKNPDSVEHHLSAIEEAGYSSGQPQNHKFMKRALTEKQYKALKETGDEFPSFVTNEEITFWENKWKFAFDEYPNAKTLGEFFDYCENFNHDLNDMPSDWPENATFMANEHTEKTPFKVGDYTFRWVDMQGDGDEYWFVFSVEGAPITFSKSTVMRPVKTFWKWSGYYSSYQGGSLDTLYQVTPREKTITVFDRVKRCD